MTPPSDLFAQARAVHQAGDPRRAEPLYRLALERDPWLVPAWYLLGVALQSLGRFDEADDSLQRALQLKPDHVEARNLLGVVHARRGRLPEAVACFREAIRHRPGAADIHNNLCLALGKLGELDEAIAAGRRSLTLRPDDSDAHVNLAFAFLEQGALEESARHYREAVRLRPDSANVLSGLLFCLNYDPKVDAATLFDEHRRWAVRHGAVSPVGPSPDHDRTPDRRLRIGYVSPNLRTHPVASFLEPILAHHDRLRFDVVCYADAPSPDAVTTRLQSLEHGWRTIHGMSDAQVVELVRGDGIDILVDLAGHTANNRLVVFARRPAPVQVTYLGYPNTTGLTTVNVLLTDAVVDPPGLASWSTERLQRLPAGFCVFEPPAYAPDVAESPCGRDGGVTFGSLHKPSKLNPGVLDLWSNVLHAVPASRLLLARNTLKGSRAAQLLAEFQARGIDPARVAIRHALEGVGPHLRVYHDIDISLDVFPWCGHTTACESLWMGVPIVTLLGGRHAGRMTASVLTSLGLTDLIADSPAHYLDLATRWAADPARLAHLRSTLRTRMRSSRLCDGRQWTRSLEVAYRELWTQWCDSPG